MFSYKTDAGHFSMSHGSQDWNMGSKRLILARDIRSRSWLNTGESYGTYHDKENINTKFTYRSVFEATLAKENTSFKSKSMNKSGNDDLNGSALELQPIMDNEALIHNRVRIYQLRHVGRSINLEASPKKNVI